MQQSPETNKMQPTAYITEVFNLKCRINSVWTKHGAKWTREVCDNWTLAPLYPSPVPHSKNLPQTNTTESSAL